MEKISKYHEIKDSDKREGISVYGENPLGGDASFPKNAPAGARSAEEIKNELDSLVASWKSSDYVGDKNKIEERINALEKELSNGDFSDGKLKTARELAMEGKIAWDRGKSSGAELPTIEETEKPKESAAQEDGGAGESGKKEETNEKETPADIPSPESGTEPFASKEKENAPERKEVSPEEEVKAAEILLAKVGSFKNKKEADEAVKKMREQFSDRSVEEAVRVAEIRDKAAEIYREAVRSGSPDALRDHALLMRDNQYRPALIALKKVLLEDKRAELEKLFPGEEDVIKEKMFLGRDGSGEGSYERVLMGIIITELQRNNEIQENVLAAENAAKGGFFKKAMVHFGKMPRGIRAVVGATITGAAVSAGVLPAMFFGGALTVRKLQKALFGGTIAGVLQKFIGNKIIDRAYTKDVERHHRDVIATAGRQVFVDRGSQDSGAAMKDLYLAKKYDEIAERNFEIAERNSARLNELVHKEKKLRRFTTLGMIIVTGAAGGAVGSQLHDWLLGGKIAPEAFAGANQEPIPETHGEVNPEPTPEISPETMKAATIGEGEGVEHAFRRQLEMDPQRFGFKGDPTYKEAVHAWAGEEAHRIAIDQGYVDKVTGEEIRVFDVGPEGAAGNPAYVLEQDSGGKLSVREYFNEKLSEGEGVKNAYEYIHEEPKIIDTPVEEEQAGSVIGEKRVEASIEPYKGPSISESIPDHLEVFPSAEEGANIFSDLERVVPRVEEMSGKFPKLTLYEQEEYLMSSEIEKIDNQIRYLGEHDLIPAPGSGHEADLLGSIRNNYAEMVEVYQQNDAAFIDAVKKAVQLDNDGFEKFTNTPIEKMWDIKNGPNMDKVSDLMKSVNITSADLSSGKTIGDVLRSKFIDGEFITVKK